MSTNLDQVPQSHADLLRSPITAALTTVDGEGRPQSTAIWYTVDDGQLVGSITSERQKFKNLQGNPNCTLFIIDPSNPYRTLEIRAVAELTADPDKSTVQTLARAYGMDGEALVHPDEDRYTVTFRPRRIVANPPADG